MHKLRPKKHFIGGVLSGLGAISGGSKASGILDTLGNGAGNILEIAGATTNSKAEEIMKKNQLANAGMDTASTALSMLGPVGAIAGMGLNAFNKYGAGLVGHEKIDTLDKDQRLATSSAYTGTSADIDETNMEASAHNESGALGFLFGGKEDQERIKREMEKRKAEQERAGIIMDDAKLGQQRLQGGIGVLNAGIQNQMQGGLRNVSQIGKKGMKLDDMRSIRLVAARTAMDNIQKKETGGKINKIADGVRHSRKNAVKNNPEFKEAQITPKGVPVITKEHGGEILQHAEIEVNELILHKEVTDKVEQFVKNIDTEGHQDKLFIELGEYMSDQINKKTKDSKHKLLK